MAVARAPHVIFNLPNITIRYVIQNITSDTDTCIAWLQQNGLLPSVMFCDCGSQCSVANRRDVSDGKSWKCRSRHCRKRISIRHGTLFENSNMKLTTLLEFLYWWANDTPQQVVQRELDIKTWETTVNWYSNCRDICTAVILDNIQPIGGPGVEVEIDESKFMHRKYHRGQYVEGKWYLGMVERLNAGNCILVQCPGNRRDAATLLPLIQHNVLPGTTIISDQWAAYNQLNNLGYVHQTVNHSLFFRDPNTGVHSNTIEGTWAHAKAKFRTMHGTSQGMHESYLSEFVWRRKFRDRSFEHLISQISEYYVV